MIPRTLAARIQPKIGRGKAIMVIGPRQVGKITLILKYLEGLDYKFFDGDDPVTRTSLDIPNTEQIRVLLENKKVVFIDEAQRINSIGLTMKIIVDQFKDVQLWISGSSSFSLFNELNEPLSERIKQNRYKLTLAKSYFWRTTQQQEIDYVEENGTELKAYEFKWSPRKKVRLSKTFTDTYQVEGEVITRENFRDFVIL